MKTAVAALFVAAIVGAEVWAFTCQPDAAVAGLKLFFGIR